MKNENSINDEEEVTYESKEDKYSYPFNFFISSF